ncbi:MAG: alpha/beta hydrolase [Pseudomonadota bacterium]
MIHCGLANSAAWGRMAKHLSGLLTMTAFDTPGHGRSDPWDARDDIQKTTAEIAADFLSGPTDIIGHSFGATAALRLAVLRPDVVRTLTLIEPVFFAAALRDKPEIAPHFAAGQRDFVTAMQNGEMREAARAFTRIWGDGTPWEAIPDSAQQMLADHMYLIAASKPALEDDIGGMLAPGVLSAIDQPVLLIEGSQSPEIIPIIHDSLSGRLPNVTRAVIMGGGHMSPITHAGQVASEVLRFLAQPA